MKIAEFQQLVNRLKPLEVRVTAYVEDGKIYPAEVDSEAAGAVLYSTLIDLETYLSLNVLTTETNFKSILDALAILVLMDGYLVNHGPYGEQLYEQLCSFISTKLSEETVRLVHSKGAFDGYDLKKDKYNFLTNLSCLSNSQLKSIIKGPVKIKAKARAIK